MRRTTCKEAGAKAFSHELRVRERELRGQENKLRNWKWKSLSRGASPERLWGIPERASARLVFLFLGGFLLGCHEVFPPLNDLFSQGSRQGTLMPELLKYLYEQLSYHKILPLVCNLSMKILL
jgi:hypothetical protein